MSILVIVLYNQPETFSSDLVDDQSCYLRLVMPVVCVYLCV